LIGNPKSEWDDRYFVTHVCRWPTGADPNKFQWQRMAIRNQKYRLVGPKTLYDMEQDPGQTTNVIDQHPDVAEKMRNYYEGWWKETLPLMVNEDAEMSPTQPFHVHFYKQKESVGIPKWNAPEL